MTRDELKDIVNGLFIVLVFVAAVVLLVWSDL